MPIAQFDVSTGVVTILDEEPPFIPVEPAPITTITPRQARIQLALTQATDAAYPHMLAQVEALFAALPEPDKTIAQITWEYATIIERDNALIAQMQAMAGLSDEQVDALFVAAAAR